MNPCEIVPMPNLREIVNVRYCIEHNALAVECERDRAVAEVVALKAERDEARADVTRLRQDLAFERNRWAGIGPTKGERWDAVG